MNEARDYELSLPTSNTTSIDKGNRPHDAQVNSQATDENRVSMTLAELKELIESGNMDKIPNNKIIPETLNVRFIFPFENLIKKYLYIYIFT